MLEFLKKQANLTHTENGAVTYGSTNSHCLDLFATVGALRHAEDRDVISRFLRAYTEDPDMSMKCLFYARDVRGGLGERRVFRTILQWLAAQHPRSVVKNLEYIAEFGRFDDTLCLMGTPCEGPLMQYIKKQLELDLDALEKGESVSLLAKWLPSVNASNAETVRHAKRIAKTLGMTDAQYRKTLVQLRAKIRIIENNLRERDYTFDYAQQPSKAMFKYRRAFARNDHERYTEFLHKVQRGEATMHTGTLLPYELVDPYLGEYHRSIYSSFMRSISQEEANTLNTTWAALPDFTNGENALVIVDTSASMYWANDPTPASVALSLGLYFAERNTGAFANHFIEFSDDPQLIEIKGETFVDRLRYIASFNEVGSTNLESVFDLILDAAVRNHVPQKELPSTLYIISDMEFNRCVRNADMTNFENAKKKFAAHGYQLPNIVFWNVASRNTQQPVTMNEQGVALVSGSSPRIFSMLSSGTLSPYAFMLEVLGSERYEKIAA